MNMSLKISVVLLHLFSTTLPTSNHAGSSLNVLASALNDSSPLQRISIITTTTADPCNASYCYRDIGIDERMNNERIELIESAKKAAGANETQRPFASTIPMHIQRNRLTSSSMVYGVLTLAVQKADKSRCYNELGQIYDGINRKEIWAIKGKKTHSNVHAAEVRRFSRRFARLRF